MLTSFLFMFWYEDLSNYYPNYSTRRLYFREVETPYLIDPRPGDIFPHPSLGDFPYSYYKYLLKYLLFVVFLSIQI